MRVLFTLFMVYCTISLLAQGNGDLIVQIKKLENNNGKVMVYIFEQDQGYPIKLNRASYLKTCKISNNESIITFPSIPYAWYAIAVVHDEDGNEKLNTNFLGIPNEPLGASNNAKGFMGPPDFDEAKFHFKTNNQKEVILMED